MLRDTSAEWRQGDRRHVVTCVNSGKTLEARLFDRVSVWSLDVSYYCCIYLVHVASVMLCECGVVYIWCCVHVFYVVLCTNGVVYMLFMQCSV